MLSLLIIVEINFRSVISSYLRQQLGEEVNPSESVLLFGDSEIVHEQEWSSHVQQLEEVHEVLAAGAFVDEYANHAGDEGDSICEEVLQHVGFEPSCFLELSIQLVGPALLHSCSQNLSKVQLLLF